MSITEKTDAEIITIANPIWQDLIKHSNNENYIGFTKNFCKEMMRGANEVEIGKQWANNKLTKNLSPKVEVFGCLRRGNFVTVLYKQTNKELDGEYLGRLVLGTEEGEVKIFGATIF